MSPVLLEDLKCTKANKIVYISIWQSTNHMILKFDRLYYKEETPSFVLRRKTLSSCISTKAQLPRSALLLHPSASSHCVLHREIKQAWHNSTHNSAFAIKCTSIILALSHLWRSQIGSGSDWANGPPPYPWISFSARFCPKVQLWRRLYREGCHPKVSMNPSFWLYFWYILTTYWLQYGYILPTC